MRERILTTHDDAWALALPAATSVFGSQQYAAITEQYTQTSARLYVIESANSRLVYPVFLRSVRALAFGANQGAELFDSLSPEYTGPMAVGNESLDLSTLFAQSFENWCQQYNVVTEFAHLHPWRYQTQCLRPEGKQLNREIVYVDLSRSLEQLWTESFTYACRKNINRARRENVRTFAATSAGDVGEFYRIYMHTMERNHAQDRYFFSLDYFKAFFEEMPDHARFVLAEYQGQIVAATLYLHDDMDVYSYLGGADQAFQQIRPTNAVVLDTIQWAQRMGKRRLILGGGYMPDDGIFRFKASFSPLRARFQVYRNIHLPEQYNNLCAAWEQYYGIAVQSNGYFPAYRSIPHVNGESEQS